MLEWQLALRVRHFAQGRIPPFGFRTSAYVPQGHIVPLWDNIGKAAHRKSFTAPQVSHN